MFSDAGTMSDHNSDNDHTFPHSNITIILYLLNDIAIWVVYVYGY